MDKRYLVQAVWFAIVEYLAVLFPLSQPLILHIPIVCSHIKLTCNFYTVQQKCTTHKHTIIIICLLIIKIILYKYSFLKFRNITFAVHNIILEGLFNSTDLDPWKQPYFIVNNTRLVSFFVFLLMQMKNSICTHQSHQPTINQSLNQNEWLNE